MTAQSTPPSAPDLFGRLSDAERAPLYAVKGVDTVALTARQGVRDRKATLALMPRPDLGTAKDGK